MDKNKCTSCGKPKCSCKNKDFTKAVIEIDNPEQITLMRRVVIPASMGDDNTVPPVVGKYHNVLLYYEANQKSYLYSSDGIPTQLVNGVTDYEAAINLPQINGNTLIGDKTGEELGLQDKLTDGDNITIENNVISATDTTYGPATDTQIGLVKPGDGLEVNTNGTLSVIDHVFDTVSDMKAATNLNNGDYAQTLGFHSVNDGGGALYKITNTGTANEMDVIAIDSLYANLIIPTIASPEMFGAYGDGVNDDSSYVNRGISLTNLEGKKIYKLDSTIILNSHDFTLHELTDTVIIDNNSDANNPVKVTIDKADTLTLQNFKNSNFYLGKIVTLNITATDSDNAFAYNTIQGGQFNNLYIYGNSTRAWVNENVFYNTRIIYNLSIIGTEYSHNHNKFYDVVCEDGTNITLTNTNCNYISYRGETNPTINISNDNLTFGNILFRTWASFEGGYVNQSEEINNNNIILKADTAYLKAYPMYSATVDSTTNTIALSNYQTLKTFILDPSKGGCIKFRSDSQTFRIRVTPLDENNNTYNDNPNAIFQVNTPWNNTNKYYWQTVNNKECNFTINSKTIAKKIKVEIYNYTAGNAGFVNMTYYGVDPYISTVE